MSIEIEAKMQVTDLAALEAKLEAVGAKRGPVHLEINRFFDSPSGSLRMADQGLRIRVEKSTDGSREVVTITYKGPRAQSKLKQRRETEIVVNDAKIAAQLLNDLGYVQTLSFEKQRRRWEFDRCHVDIDTLPYLGDYVEIEGPDDKVILGVREKLGLGKAPLIRAGYAAMLTQYLAEHHLRAEHVPLKSS
ncbi:MAG: class IV adenylate cyclase [Phycisphaeraceae bacterium]|nr:class IV adenylate cyclase [Phycisphaeraceae bacterium]